MMHLENLIKFKMADLRPSLTLKSVIYMDYCARWIGHNCKTKCESSGKDAPWIFSFTRAGRGDYGGRLASCSRLWKETWIATWYIHLTKCAITIKLLFLHSLHCVFRVYVSVIPIPIHRDVSRSYSSTTRQNLSLHCSVAPKAQIFGPAK